RHRRDRAVWQLAWAMATYLDRGSNWAALASTQRSALAAATRLGDLRAQARACHGIARAHVRQQQLRDGARYLRVPLDLLRRLDDTSGQAQIHCDIATVRAAENDNRGALTEVQQAYRLFRRVGQRRHVARALNGIGWYHAQLGENERSMVYSRRAI